MGVYIENWPHLHCYLSYTTEIGLILKHRYSPFILQWVIQIFEFAYSWILMKTLKMTEKSLKIHK